MDNHRLGPFHCFVVATFFALVGFDGGWWYMVEGEDGWVVLDLGLKQFAPNFPVIRRCHPFVYHRRWHTGKVPKSNRNLYEERRNK